MNNTLYTVTKSCHDFTTMQKVAGTLEQFPAQEKPTVSAKELLDRIKGLGVSLNCKTVNAEDSSEEVVKKANQAEQEKLLKRRRILSTLIPALASGGYGALLGGMEGNESGNAGMGALIGGGAGTLLGGAAGMGGQALREYMGTDPSKFPGGDPGVKQANIIDKAKAELEKTLQGRHLMDDIKKNVEREPAAMNVLHGNSAAIPDWAVRSGVGAGAGYLGGGALAGLVTPEIDPRMSEGEAEDIHGKRNKIKRIAALLGGVAGGMTADGATENIDKVRKQFAV